MNEDELLEVIRVSTIIAARYVKTLHDRSYEPQDIVMEAIAKCLAAFKRRNLTALEQRKYIFRSVHNTALSLYRKDKHFTDVATFDPFDIDNHILHGDGIDYAEQLTNKMLIDSLIEGLENGSEKEARTLRKLRVIALTTDGMTGDELGKIRGCTRQAITHDKMRGIREIRKHFSGTIDLTY